MPERTKYQQQLDSERLSPEKADETLSLMLNENAKLAEKRERGGVQIEAKRHKLAKYIPVLATAAAAALVLVLLLTPDKDTAQSGSTASPVGTIASYIIPCGQVAYHKPAIGARGGAQDFENVFGFAPAELFPGASVVSSNAVNSNGRKRAEIKLESDAQAFTAYVEDAEDDLTRQLEDVAEYNGIKYNFDASSDIRSAVYQARGLWIRIDAEHMDDETFKAAVKELKQ